MGYGMIVIQPAVNIFSNNLEKAGSELGISMGFSELLVFHGDIHQAFYDFYGGSTLGNP